MDSPYPVNFEDNLTIASDFMKVLANRQRLKIMCHLTSEPHNVSELMALTAMSQTALSHQLARLRDDGMLVCERKGKEMYYSIAKPMLAALVEDVCYRFQCWRNEDD